MALVAYFFSTLKLWRSLLGIYSRCSCKKLDLRTHSLHGFGRLLHPWESSGNSHEGVKEHISLEIIDRWCDANTKTMFGSGAEPLHSNYRNKVQNLKSIKLIIK